MQWVKVRLVLSQYFKGRPERKERQSKKDRREIKMKRKRRTQHSRQMKEEESVYVKK